MHAAILHSSIYSQFTSVTASHFDGIRRPCTAVGEKERPHFSNGNINPCLTNGFSHHYHLGKSTFVFRGVRSDLEYLFHFWMKFP